MKTVVVASRKGGVAKTTSVQNLGHLLATTYSQKVLLIDSDSQSNLTLLSGRDAEDGRLENLEAHLNHRNIFSPASLREGITLLRGSLGVAAFNEFAFLHSYMDGLESIFSRAKAGGIDIVLIDTPPGNGSLLIGALAVSELFLGVTELGSLLSSHGLQLLIDTSTDVKRRYRTNLEFLGVLPTLASRESLSAAGLTALHETVGKSGVRVFTPIRRDAKVKKAAIARRPVVEMFTPRASAAVADYHAACATIAQALGIQQAANLLPFLPRLRKEHS